ncbi:MAG TPA: hypothetical protein HPP80_02695 [Rhodospirillaceae bacterium]|nr:hypothetical protein [Rhodospirillaceae bacterium]
MPKPKSFQSPWLSLIYAALMAYAVLQGLLAPYGNWDMLCYVASVTAWTTPDSQEIFSQTMTAAQAALPAWLFDQHSHNPLSLEGANFVQVLPMCQIKPLYNAMIWLAHQIIRLDLPTASWTVSAFSFAVMAVLLYRWRPRRFVHPLWLALVLALSFLGELPLASLARLSTPDALCTALTVAAFSAALFARNPWAFALSGWLATLARPDAAILIGGLALYFFWFGQFGRQRSKALGFVLVGFLAASQILVGKLAGSYGWEKMFVYTFLNRVPNLAQDQTPLTWAGYLQVLSGGFVLFAGAGRTLGLLGLSALACLARFLRPVPEDAIYLRLLALSWAGIGGRFLIWPAWGEDRFYYGYFLLILYCAAELVGPYGQALWKILEDHRRQIRQAALNPPPE